MINTVGRLLQILRPTTATLWLTRPITGCAVQVFFTALRCRGQPATALCSSSPALAATALSRVFDRVQLRGLGDSGGSRRRAVVRRQLVGGRPGGNPGGSNGGAWTDLLGTDGGVHALRAAGGSVRARQHLEPARPRYPRAASAGAGVAVVDSRLQRRCASCCLLGGGCVGRVTARWSFHGGYAGSAIGMTKSGSARERHMAQAESVVGWDGLRGCCSAALRAAALLRCGTHALIHTSAAGYR